MKTKSWIKIVCIALACLIVVGLVIAIILIVRNKAPISNEDTPFVMSSEALDGVFNPFFYSAGADGNIVGLTQLSMLSSNGDGLVVVGENEASAVLDYNVVPTGERPNKPDLTEEDYKNFYTTYQFVIKDGLKFSDGSDLTIEDILFNMYMYLDPTYTGSSTMYSINIQGLQAYRTQTDNSDLWENFDEQFDTAAANRISAIRNWSTGVGGLTEQIKADIKTIRTLFKEELETDWNSAAGSIESYKDTFQFQQGWEIFFYNYGYIVKTNPDDPDRKESLDYNGFDTRTELHEKENAIEYVLTNMLGDSDTDPAEFEQGTKDKIYEVVTYYQTANSAQTQFAAEEKAKYFEENPPSIREISGITTFNLPAGTPFTCTDPDEAGDGYTTSTTTYDKDMQVLQVKINGVDPKALWNFGFSVAPMKYYSEPAKAAIAEEYPNAVINHGVAFSNFDFMQAIRENQVPMGAGPYKASSESNKESGVTKSEFFDNNVVYYIRNDNFLLGAPRIKKVRYKVISTNQVLNAVMSGNEVHYATPSATIENVNQVKEKDFLGYRQYETLGYGYIGINAFYVNDLEVRQAMMYSMNTSLALLYYKNEMAELIYRPMSILSWAYPDGAESYYPYLEDEAERAALVQDLVESVGYEKNSAGKYTRMGDDGKEKRLKFTFTIAGESTDHPVYQIFKNASEFLNKNGFEITVVNDAQALTKLANGKLEVWGAAWSSTIDPDMFQVYHKDSKATSVQAWGYPYLLENGTPTEKAIINELSELIDEGRETMIQESEDPTVRSRKVIYGEALDYVMQLAVELPVYQRNDLFVYNKNIIDESSLNQNPTAYDGLLSKIWEVSFRESV